MQWNLQWEAVTSLVQSQIWSHAPLMVYYRLPAKLQEGNVFCRVCLSVCPLVHLDLTTQGHLPLPPTRSNMFTVWSIDLSSSWHSTQIPSCSHCGGTGPGPVDWPIPGPDTISDQCELFYIVLNFSFDLVPVQYEKTIIAIITACKRSCGKVMFSQALVCPQGGGRYITCTMGYVT